MFVFLLNDIGYHFVLYHLCILSEPEGPKGLLQLQVGRSHTEDDGSSRVSAQGRPKDLGEG